MKNHKSKSIINSYETLYNSRATKSLNPRLQKLDYEYSNILIQILQDENIDFHLVKSNMHRHNAAEQVIQTFKNYFISGLCSVNPNFQLKFCDRLLDQSMTTLNFVCKSRINPNLSAYEKLFRIFNFNCTQFAPPGKRILVHDKP